MKQLGPHLTAEHVSASVEQLRCLYPEEVCEAGIRDNTLPAGVEELFFPGLCLRLRGIVLLGIDLTLAHEWRRDSGLVERLRHIKSFGQGRAEVGVWAGLVRSGVEVHRPTESKRQRTSDFEVATDGKTISIEVKTMGSGALSRASSGLEHSWSRLLTESRTGAPLTSIMGKTAILQLRDDLRARIADSRTQSTAVEELNASLPAAFDTLAGMLDPATPLPARSEIPGIGFVSVDADQDGDSGNYGLVGIPELPEEDQIKRLIKRAKEGAKQLAGCAHPGVLVLELPGRTLDARWASHHLAAAMERSPQDFGSLDASVLLSPVRRSHGMGHDWAVSAYRPSWSRLTGIPTAVLSGIASWRHTC